MFLLGFKNRIRPRVALALLTVLSFAFVLWQLGRTYQVTEVEAEYKPIVGNFQYDPRHKFWDNVFEVMDKARIVLKDSKDAIKYVDSDDKGKNKAALLKKASISDEVKEEFAVKHKLFLDNLPNKWSESTFHKGTTGIVLIGGGKFSWLSYLSILALRKAGSRLPIEILIPRYDDFAKETDFCTVVLPPLNAACVLLPDVVGAQVMKKWHNKINSYALKSLALLITSFENILLLDSDNMVLSNPDPIFASSIYKDYGMITWPDYWRRAISPVYYEIAGIKVDETKRVRVNRFPITPVTVPADKFEEVPYHDFEGTVPDLSTESGQLVINKVTHFSTLLLSLYYNMNGPDLYYKMFSLGDMGAGDKDTFPTAAVALKKSYYAVKSYIKTLGYADADGKFQGIGMGQANPMLDFQRYQKTVLEPLKKGDLKNLPSEEQIKTLKDMAEDFRSNDILFTLHCNYPKLDPVLLMDREDLFDKNKKRLKYRMYGGFLFDDPNIRDRKVDFELEQWKTMQENLCGIESIYFVHFEKKSIDSLCEFIDNQVQWLSKGA